MMINENALAVVRAAYDADGFDGGLVSADDIRNIVTLYLTAMPLTALPSAHRPPEGKLRVRVCVSAEPGGRWFAEGRSDMIDDYARARVVPADVKRPHRVTWIEADVTPWQPPAEETVQGREVEG